MHSHVQRGNERKITFLNAIRTTSQDIGVFEWWNLQVAQAYKHMFGELPSQTLQESVFNQGIFSFSLSSKKLFLVIMFIKKDK